MSKLIKEKELLSKEVNSLQVKILESQISNQTGAEAKDSDGFLVVNGTEIDDIYKTIFRSNKTQKIMAELSGLDSKKSGYVSET